MSFDSNSAHPFDNDETIFVDETNTHTHTHTHTHTPIEDNDVVFVSEDDAEAPPSAPIYGFGSNGSDAPENGSVFVESDGPVLPPPDEMQQEGQALLEWRRQNAILLEQKEKTEKEILSQIIEEANGYKDAFHEKRKVTCENNKNNNREREKIFMANQEMFHKEADNNYWKAIAELIPNEVPALEKRRGKKDQEKKPGVVVIQGPKPGKPTDLVRMRQILVKLKHTTPAHLKLTPPQAEAGSPDAKTGEAAGGPKTAAVAAASEAVAVA